MAYKTACNRCNALVTVLDDGTGREEGHVAPCVPSDAPEVGEPAPMVPKTE